MSNELLELVRQERQAAPEPAEGSGDDLLDLVKQTRQQADDLKAQANPDDELLQQVKAARQASPLAPSASPSTASSQPGMLQDVSQGLKTTGLAEAGGRFISNLPGALERSVAGAAALPQQALAGFEGAMPGSYLETGTVQLAQQELADMQKPQAAPVLRSPLTPQGFQYSYERPAVTSPAPLTIQPEAREEELLNIVRAAREGERSYGASAVRDTAFTALNLSGAGTAVGLAATVGLPAVLDASGAGAALGDLGAYVNQAIQKGIDPKDPSFVDNVRVFLGDVTEEVAKEAIGLAMLGMAATRSARAKAAPEPTAELPGAKPEAVAPDAIAKSIERNRAKVEGTRRIGEKPADYAAPESAPVSPVRAAVGAVPGSEVKSIGGQPSLFALAQKAVGKFPSGEVLIEKAEGTRIGGKLLEAARKTDSGKAIVELAAKMPSGQSVLDTFTSRKELLDPRMSKALSQFEGDLNFANFTTELIQKQLANIPGKVLNAGGEPISNFARQQRITQLLEGLPEVFPEKNQLRPYERGVGDERGFLDPADVKGTQDRWGFYRDKHLTNIKSVSGGVDPIADNLAANVKAYQSLFRDITGQGTENFYNFKLKGKALAEVNRKLDQNVPLTVDERLALRGKLATLKEKLSVDPAQAASQATRYQADAERLKTAAPTPSFVKPGEVKLPGIPKPEPLPKIPPAGKAQGTIAEPTPKQVKAVIGAPKANLIPEVSKAEKKAILGPKGPTKAIEIKRIGDKTVAPEIDSTQRSITYYLPEDQRFPSFKQRQPSHKELMDRLPKEVQKAELVDAQGQPIKGRRPSAVTEKGITSPNPTQVKILTPAEANSRSLYVKNALLDMQGREIGKQQQIDRIMDRMARNKPLDTEQYNLLKKAAKDLVGKLAAQPEKIKNYNAAKEVLIEQFGKGERGYMKRVYAPRMEALQQEILNGMSKGKQPRQALRTREEGFTKRQDSGELAEAGMTPLRSPTVPVGKALMENARLGAARKFFDAIKDHEMVDLETPKSNPKAVQGLLDSGEWGQLADSDSWGPLRGALVHKQLWDVLHEANSVVDSGSLNKNMTALTSILARNKAVGTFASQVSNFFGNSMAMNVDVGIPLHDMPRVVAEGVKAHNHPEFGAEVRRQFFQGMAPKEIENLLKAEPELAKYNKLVSETEAKQKPVIQSIGEALDAVTEVVRKGAALGVGEELSTFISPAKLAEINRQTDVALKSGAYIWLRERGYNDVDAGRIVKSAMVDYSNKSAAVESLKRFGVGGLGNNFAQFAFSMGARALHTGTSMNPVVAARFWKWPALIAGMNALTQQAYDIPDEKLAKLDRLDDPDQRGPAGMFKVYLPPDKDGNLNKAYVGRWNPYSIVFDTASGIKNVMESEDGVQLLARVLQPHMGIGPAWEVASNYSAFYNAEIRPKGSSVTEPSAVRSVADYLASSYAPDQWGRLLVQANNIRAQRGDEMLTDIRGLRKDEKELLVQQLLGLRMGRMEEDRLEMRQIKKAEAKARLAEGALMNSRLRPEEREDFMNRRLRDMEKALEKTEDK